MFVPIAGFNDLKQQQNECYLVKDLSDIGLRLSKPHGEQLRSFDRDEICLALVGNGFGQKSLTTTRRAIEQHTLGWGHAKLEELVRVLNWVLKKEIGKKLKFYSLRYRFISVYIPKITIHTCTNSCSSLLTSSRPPMSSQVMLGTSTTVSLRADGLLWLRAHCRTGLSLLVRAQNPKMGNVKNVLQSPCNSKLITGHTLKSSMVTAREFMTSASMVSSSRSIRSIFFLMACRAASEQRAARSAPTCPWVSLATCIEGPEWSCTMAMSS